MLGFINERSLQEHTEWTDSLTVLLLAAQELGSVDTVLYRDSEFFEASAFKKRFNTLVMSKDVRGLVRDMVFSSRYYRCWRPDRQSLPADTYECAEPPTAVVDESLSEAAARQISNSAAIIAVLSAVESAFGAVDHIDLRKDASGETVSLPNLVSIVKVQHWIARQRGFYDKTSGASPRDFQTVLGKRPDRFHPTKHRDRVSHRRVYEESDTRRLYYVDHAHRGAEAHLEVFEASGAHVGTADIDSGELRPRTAIRGRVMRL